jgi:hypothetical protein
MFTSFEQLSDFIDNIDIADFDKLLNAYISQAFTFIPSTEYVCSNEECKADNVEFIDIVEEMVDGFFA